MNPWAHITATAHTGDTVRERTVCGNGKGVSSSQLGPVWTELVSNRIFATSGIERIGNHASTSHQLINPSCQLHKRTTSSDGNPALPGIESRHLINRIGTNDRCRVRCTHAV